jgi:glucans biosynthesis protein
MKELSAQNRNKNGTYLHSIMLYKKDNSALGLAPPRAGQAGQMIGRRQTLKLILGGAAGGLAARPCILPAFALPAPSDPGGAPRDFALGEPSPFGAGTAIAEAKDLSRKLFKPISSELPPPFRGLTYEQYASIREQPGTAIWTAEKTGFTIEPLHRGFIFASPVELNLVADGQARRIIYDPALYDFGSLTVPDKIGDMGFSGFRILAQASGGPALLAIFQGATFFRAVAAGQTPGAIARALSINTADTRAEEIPFFRKIWIERPSLAAAALVIYALIDSESITGACRFTLRPGEATIIDTECTLFARAAVDNLGLSAISAAHFSCPLGQRRSDDLRPCISETGGLQMLTGKGEWLWRPVSNRDTLQLSAFADENPRGFGFLQRDRFFDHYQDDDQHFESRPSLWIEPIGDWAQGALQLIEIPSDSEANDNIIAYWKPKQPLAAGSEVSYAYRQFWCWSPPEQPPLAVAMQSRSGKGSAPKRRRFLVEFTGETLGEPETLAAMKPNLNVAPGAILSLRSFARPDNKSCRVLFEIDPGGESYTEMRLVLEAAGKPLSETWLYRWTV